MKLKQIFNKNVAMELKRMGNRIEDATVNFKKENFVIYLFEETDKLLKDLTIINDKK